MLVKLVMLICTSCNAAASSWQKGTAPKLCTAHLFAPLCCKQQIVAYISKLLLLALLTVTQHIEKHVPAYHAQKQHKTARTES